VKIYEIEIKPKSAFATHLKGDTLFGALCWHIQNMGLDLPNFLKDYDTNPFMIVSSGFYKKGNEYYFDKPLAPNFMLFGEIDVDNRKKNDNKKYFSYVVDSPLILNKLNYAEQNFVVFTDTMHATINRDTNTTGKDEFSPYSTEAFFFTDKADIVIFAAIDENRLQEEKLKSLFENLGKSGFGKRASVGYGQFEVLGFKESVLWKNNLDGNYLYALSPFVLSGNEKENLNNMYFQPFTRYGIHGDILAKSQNPFKKPVIMADSASLVSLKTNYDKTCPIIGNAVKGTSKILLETVVQGYSLCLPIQLEDNNENK
jgi:CRISPR-associated protein Csm4